MGQQWWAWLVLAQTAKQVQSWRAEQPSEPLRPAHPRPTSCHSLALDLGQKRLNLGIERRPGVWFRWSSWCWHLLKQRSRSSPGLWWQYLNSCNRNTLTLTPSLMNARALPAAWHNANARSGLNNGEKGCHWELILSRVTDTNKGSVSDLGGHEAYFTTCLLWGKGHSAGARRNTLKGNRGCLSPTLRTSPLATGEQILLLTW